MAVPPTLPSVVDWAKIVETCTPAIVELRVNYVRYFEDQEAGCGIGTGFVVDKERGFILTNRHVVSSGPVTATAVFTNKKLINVIPVYRDPIHDFGFFKYNPEDIDYPELVEVRLAPEVTSRCSSICDDQIVLESENRY